MINQKLAEDIINLAKQDQDIRRKYLKNKKRWTEELELVDNKNLIKIKEIIAKYGWPSNSLVGKKASHLFWLLVQHADHDVKFQKRCLNLMEENTPDWAYLIDRILVNEGKSQIYGTQFFENPNGKLIPRPIKNVKMLEKRRKVAGLGSFKTHSP